MDRQLSFKEKFLIGTGCVLFGPVIGAIIGFFFPTLLITGLFCLIGLCVASHLVVGSSDVAQCSAGVFITGGVGLIGLAIGFIVNIVILPVVIILAMIGVPIGCVIGCILAYKIINISI